MVMVLPDTVAELGVVQVSATVAAAESGRLGEYEPLH